MAFSASREEVHEGSRRRQFVSIPLRSIKGGTFDLEIEVPRMVYEILDIARERHWELSVHRGSIHVLPS